MTDKQSNELSMSKAVQQILDANPAIVRSIPAFQTAKIEFDRTLSAINDAAQAPTKKITVSAEDKQKAGKDAIDLAIAMTGPAKSLARTTENDTMFQAINYNHSDFQSMDHTVTVSTLKVIRDITKANAAALADYGVTAALIRDLTDFINVYGSLASTPGNASSAKSVATKALTASFKELRAIIKRLDGFMEAKKKSDPGFYKAYKSARVIVDKNGKINSKGMGKKPVKAIAVSTKKVSAKKVSAKKAEPARRRAA